MDGVLIDSTAVHTRAWEIYLERHNLPPNGVGKLMHGLRNDQIVRVLFGADLPKKEVDAHGAAKERLYRELMAPVFEERLVPGIREFLARTGSTPRALASNAEPENIDFVLDLGRFRGSFEAVVDGHEVTHPKPHPEAYVVAAARIGKRPQDCIVFEDSVAGVGAARAAGAKVAGIETTLRPVPGTDISVRNFRDPGLWQWLHQLNF